MTLVSKLRRRFELIPKLRRGIALALAPELGDGWSTSALPPAPDPTFRFQVDVKTLVKKNVALASLMKR